MLFEKSKIKLSKSLQAVASIALVALLVVAGCMSTERAVKQNQLPVKTEIAPKKAQPPVKVNTEQLQRIGQKIYKNETGGNLKNLIFWSVNEDFASLGVGHFIWYPQGRAQGFKETFPDMIRYLKANGANVPGWLFQQIHAGSLWSSKQQLEEDRGSLNFQELQTLLVDNKGLQVAYLFERLEGALPKMLSAVSPAKHSLITDRFNTMKASSNGLYPLVDYVNFKGEGTALSERYQGLGWGLLQVLESMEDVPAGAKALQAFATAADFVLTRRVSNAALEKNEQRWLSGWRVRLDTYHQDL